MKINKILKIIVAIMVLMTLVLFMSSVYAGWQPDWTRFDSQHSGDVESKVTNFMGIIVNVISIIGAGVAVIMLVSTGIRYVSASAGGKAEMKKSFTNYIIGAVMIFAAIGILKIIQNFIDNNINN